MHYKRAGNMRRINRIHFIGIGGSGMCGIAEVCLNLGYEVTGSDISLSSTVEHLIALGALVKIGHDASYVDGADVIVVSTAVQSDNPEVVAAKAAGIPIIARAQMLGELMRFHYGIAVAGTHGKTTTTSLLAAILEEAGLDPTFVVGGRVNKANSNNISSSQLGLGEYFVAEADESDASFLHLRPMAAIVTNIDKDHMSTYAGDFETLKKTFVDFLHHLPFYGLVVLCIDNPGIRQIIPSLQRPFLTYGESEDADFQLLKYHSDKLSTEFVVKTPFGVSEFTVALPGKHSALNSIAAMAIATDLGVSAPAIRRGLMKFKGVGRRFQLHPDVPLAAGGTISVMEDYGHHPTEIQSVMNALTEAYPKKRIVLVFQPHRYSRTEELFAEFVDVLKEYPNMILTNIYPAGEKPIDGISTAKLIEAIEEKSGHKICFAQELSDVRNCYQLMAQDNDLVVMMGAGSIGSVAANFYKGGPL